MSLDIEDVGGTSVSHPRRELSEDMTTLPPGPSSRHTTMEPAFEPRRQSRVNVMSCELRSGLPCTRLPANSDSPPCFHRTCSRFTRPRATPSCGPSLFGDISVSSLLAEGRCYEGSGNIYCYLLLIQGACRV